MRRRDLAQLHRVDRREPEVEHARPETVLPRHPVLLEVAEGGQRGHVAVRRAAAEPDVAPELADAEERPARAEGREDREAALERLRVRRALAHGSGSMPQRSNSWDIVLTADTR